MTEPAFDTLSIARRLESEYGFDSLQAEGVATVVYKNLIGNVSTKEDIARLETVTKEDIARLERSTKEDIAEVKEGIIRLEQSTKSDNARLERSTKEDIAEVKEGIIRLEQSTKSDNARLEQSTKSDIARLEKYMNENFATKAELYRLISAQTALIVGIMLALKFIS